MLSKQLLVAAIVTIGVLGSRAVPAAGTGELTLTVIDRNTGKPVACRMHLWNANRKRPIRPRDRSLAAWHDHFLVPGQVTLRLPYGTYEFELDRGPEYSRRMGHFIIKPFASDTKQVDLVRYANMAERGWWSADMDVRRPSQQLELILRAEDLRFVPALTDRPQQSVDTELHSTEDGRFYSLNNLVVENEGGELLVFGLQGPLEIPSGDAGNLSLVPIARIAKRQGAWIELTRPYWLDMPILVANQLVDSIQVLNGDFQRTGMADSSAKGFERDKGLYPASDGVARWSQEIYFRLLNSGLFVPPTGGSGSGKTPNPAGYNRMYVFVGDQFQLPLWWEALKRGRVTLSNGPILVPSVLGRPPGCTFQVDEGQTLELEIPVTIHSRDRIEYLEIIKNGQIYRSIPFAKYAENPQAPKIRFSQTGWFALRVVAAVPETYRCGLTGPCFVRVGSKPHISRAAAQFFLNWSKRRADQLRSKLAGEDSDVWSYYERAVLFWEKLCDVATAP